MSSAKEVKKAWANVSILQNQIATTKKMCMSLAQVRILQLWVITESLTLNWLMVLTSEEEQSITMEADGILFVVLVFLTSMQVYFANPWILQKLMNGKQFNQMNLICTYLMIKVS